MSADTLGDVLPAVDLENAARWAALSARIGRRASHGAAHDPDATAWYGSGHADWLAVRDALGAVEGERFGQVLDWGAGAGRLEVFIAGQAEWVFAADVADAVCEAEALNVSPVVTDLPIMAVPAASMGDLDLVVCLHHCYALTPQGMRETVRQLGHLLRHGGRLVADIPWWEAEYDHHRDPDPEGLPGGWRVHSAKMVASGIDGLWLERVPPPLRYQHGATPRWADLEDLKLWVWRRM